MKIIELFLVFLQVGAVSFGGGYSILKTIMHYIVDTKNWLTPEEFAEIVAISQSTPGPIGINAATFVGYKVAGVLGSVIATLSSILVPVVLSLLMFLVLKRYAKSKVFNKMLNSAKPVVMALIFSAAFSFIKVSSQSIITILLSIFAFLILLFTKVDQILLFLIFGLLGYVFLK